MHWGALSQINAILLVVVCMKQYAVRTVRMGELRPQSQYLHVLQMQHVSIINTIFTDSTVGSNHLVMITILTVK